MRLASGLAGVVCIISLAVGCAATPTRKVSLSNTGASTPAVIFSAGSPCLDEPDIGSEARASAVALQKGLQRLGFSPVTVVPDATRPEVLTAVRSMGPNPALVAYTGHGALLDSGGAVRARCPERGAACQSVLCLADGEKLALDEIVAEVPATTRLAVLLVDACSSAHVDLRRARAPVSILSASPFSTKVSDSHRTPFSEALAEFPVDVDLNCDYRLADWELFYGLNRLVPLVDAGSAQPKLRRQIRGEAAPLLSTGRITCFPKRKERSEELPDRRETFACEAGRCSRVEGFVAPGASISIDDKSYPHDSVVATPCLDDTGQCFRLARDAAASGKSNGTVR